MLSFAFIFRAKVQLFFHICKQMGKKNKLFPTFFCLKGESGLGNLNCLETLNESGCFPFLSK